MPSPDRPPTERWMLSAELVPLLGGHRNTVLRTIGLAENFVFKSTKRSPKSVEWLSEVHHLARQVGFVVPHQKRSLNGNLIEDGWTCEELIEGETALPSDLLQIEPILSEFHKETADLPQRPSFQSSKALRYLSAGGDIDLREMPRSLAHNFREAWDAVADRSEGIIHGDLNPGNVLKTNDGRFALIDWDESRRDLLLFDTGQIRADDKASHRARIAWEIATCWLVEPERARSLAENF